MEIWRGISASDLNLISHFFFPVLGPSAFVMFKYLNSVKPISLGSSNKALALRLSASETESL